MTISNFYSKRIFTPMFFSVVVLFVGGCTTEAAPATNAMPVEVAKPVIQSIVASKPFPAVLEAVDRAVLRAQVSGYLDSIDFVEGGFVKQGDSLFRIDSRLFNARLQEAKAALDMAHTEADLARTERDRALRLQKRNAIPVEEVERRISLADLADLKIKTAEAAYELANLDLEFSHIRAPFDGRIGRAKVTPGNLVANGDELAIIVANEMLLVRFDMDENEYLRLISRNDDTSKQTASEKWSVNFAHETREVSGPVTIVENEVRAGTGTVRLRAQISNADGYFLPGMFGQANLIYGHEQNAVLISENAIGSNQGQRFVLVVNEQNTLDYRAISTGSAQGELRHIVNGISADERIVVNGLMRVRPGFQVAPHEVSMQPGDSRIAINQ